MRHPCFVLVHSPLVGPATWKWTGEELERRGAAVVVPSLLGLDAQPGPRWRACSALVQAAVPARGDFVLVAHSGSGPYLPLVAAEVADRAVSCIFADARLPARPGETCAPDPALQQLAASLARNGTLPPWSEWWGPEAMQALVPDAARRALIEAELPTLPVSFFDEAIPSPVEWLDQATFLQFSDAYVAEADEAASRGWRVERIAGGHLHMVVDPVAVTDCILDLAVAR